MSHSNLYKAPFASGGRSEIDAQLAEKLLAVALVAGRRLRRPLLRVPRGGRARLRRGHPEERVARRLDGPRRPRAARATRPGYAYVEQLDWDAMKRAAETAAQIAIGRRRAAPAARSSSGTLPSRYELDKVTLDVPGHRQAHAPRARGRRGARRTIRASSRSRRASPRRSARSSSSRATASSRATCSRSCASAFASSPSATASARRELSGGGGRTTHRLLRRQDRPSGTRSEAAEQAIRMLDAQEAPAGQMEVVLAPGDSGILLHEAVGHGLEADFNRKGTSNYAGQIGKRRRERALHRRRRRDAPPVARLDQRRRRGQRAAVERAHRERQARRLHARPPEREALQARRRAATAGARASRARRCRA